MYLEGPALFWHVWWLRASSTARRPNLEFLSCKLQNPTGDSLRRLCNSGPIYLGGCPGPSNEHAAGLEHLQRLCNVDLQSLKPYTLNPRPYTLYPTP